MSGLAAADKAWPEMSAGWGPAETVVAPPTEEGRDPDGWVEMAVDDREVAEIDNDTPPRNSMVEQVEIEGGGGAPPRRGSHRRCREGCHKGH